MVQGKELSKQKQRKMLQLITENPDITYYALGKAVDIDHTTAKKYKLKIVAAMAQSKQEIIEKIAEPEPKQAKKKGFVNRILNAFLGKFIKRSIQEHGEKARSGATTAAATTEPEPKLNSV